MLLQRSEPALDAQQNIGAAAAEDMQQACAQLRSAGAAELRCAAETCHVAPNRRRCEMSSAAKPEAHKPTAMPAPKGLNICSRSQLAADGSAWHLQEI